MFAPIPVGAFLVFGFGEFGSEDALSWVLNFSTHYNN